jgi:hypothetical protein
LRFRLNESVPICPGGTARTFAGRVNMMTRARSKDRHLIFFTGVVDNGPAHSFMFCALCDPLTGNGQITFHNLNNPSRNSPRVPFFIFHILPRDVIR